MSTFETGLPQPAPSTVAIQEAFGAAFSSGKALRADYWFTPGAANVPRLGYVNDIKTGSKKLVFGNDEYTSWIDGLRKTADGNAFICETANSIYLVPAAPGALKAVKLEPGMPAYE